MSYISTMSSVKAAENTRDWHYLVWTIHAVIFSYYCKLCPSAQTIVTFKYHCPFLRIAYTVIKRNKRGLI